MKKFNFIYIALWYILHVNTHCTQTTNTPCKKYTLLVFMAADNNLARFALYNLDQMMQNGSNDYINVLVQINVPGKDKKTERYFVGQGYKKLITSKNESPQSKLNSGCPETLINAAIWAMQYYPAEHLILNLWSHGSGVYDPGRTMDNLTQINQKGICFDDTYKSYMNNLDIKFALQEIQKKALKGKKIEILWLEACLMSMIEVASIYKDHANFLISSQNVEYAPGSKYAQVLSIFKEKNLNSHHIVSHIIECFQAAYQTTKLNYTQSGINLSKIKALEENINLIAHHITKALQEQKGQSVVNMLKKCKSRPTCTCFHEPSYIDLHNFYTNLKANIDSIQLINQQNQTLVKLSILKLINQGIYLINQAVVANTAGNNVKDAKGISIYFPERAIFTNYLQTSFAQENEWSKMIIKYTSLNR